jgi:alpha-tubulin suppressor-like RCC1 family protein
VTYGASSNITAFSTCKKVTNNSSKALSLYVPTTSSGEWSSFYTNPPAGVTIGSCLTSYAFCWGNNGNGQIGNGTTSTPSSMVPVNMPSGVTSLTLANTGGTTSCALADTGQAYCWGNGSDGELGNGSLSQQTSPVQVTLPSGVTSWSALTTGYADSCAIGNNGKAYCWGSGTSGQLGNGGSSDSSTPVQVTLPSGVTSWTAINSGTSFSCAIGNNGKAYCWGIGTSGQLGNSASSNSSTPVQVTFPSGVTSWTAVSAGYQTACAIGNNGKAYCWGYGGNAQIGNGGSSSYNSPQQVTLPSGVTSWTVIAAGYQASCGIGNNGLAYCWGSNNAGELGNGTTTISYTPTQVTLPSGVTAWTAISAKGYNSTCGVGNDGNGYCWGSNSYGQLGDGSTSSSNLPVQVTYAAPAISQFTSIIPGQYSTCGTGGFDPAGTCDLPWGGTVGIGSSVTAYSASTGTCTNTCASYSQSRTCTAGVLGGSFTNQSCTDATGCKTWTVRRPLN